MYRFPLALLAAALLFAGCQEELVAPESESPEPSPDAPAVSPTAPPESDPTTSFFPWAARLFCDVLVPDDASAVQDGVDAATSGDVVCVRSGTYEESVVVSTPGVTLRGFGFHPPVLVGQTSEAITVDADDVTVKGLKVRNPGRLIGIKVTSGHTGVTIAGNRVYDVGPTGRLGTVGIIVDEPQSDLTIFYNRVHDVHQTGAFDPDNGDPSRRFPTAQGIFFDDLSGGGITNASVTANWVHDVSSEYGAIGVLVNAAAQGVSIRANRIRDVEADGGESVAFAQGIGVSDTGPTDLTIKYNDVRDVVSTTFPGTAVKVESGTVPNNLTVSFNNLVSRVGLENGSETTVAAECNWWGHPTGPSVEGGRPNKGSIALENPGAIDARPWLVRPLGRGALIGNACVGGRGR